MSEIMVEQVDFTTVPDNLPPIPHKEKGDGHVLQWAERIKPLTTLGGKLYHCNAKCNHFNQSFPWVAEATVPATDLIEVSKIWTLHLYGYYGFFKPSLAEVIWQIPDNLLPEVDYVLVQGPDMADDLNDTIKYVDEGWEQLAPKLENLGK